MSVLIDIFALLEWLSENFTTRGYTHTKPWREIYLDLGGKHCELEKEIKLYYFAVTIKSNNTIVFDFDNEVDSIKILQETVLWTDNWKDDIFQKIILKMT